MVRPDFAALMHPYEPLTTVAGCRWLLGLPVCDCPPDECLDQVLYIGPPVERAVPPMRRSPRFLPVSSRRGLEWTLQISYLSHCGTQLPLHLRVYAPRTVVLDNSTCDRTITHVTPARAAARDVPTWPCVSGSRARPLLAGPVSRARLPLVY